MVVKLEHRREKECRAFQRRAFNDKPQLHPGGYTENQ